MAPGTVAESGFAVDSFSPFRWQPMIAMLRPIASSNDAKIKFRFIQEIDFSKGRTFYTVTLLEKFLLEKEKGNWELGIGNWELGN